MIAAASFQSVIAYAEFPSARRLLHSARSPCASGIDRTTEELPEFTEVSAELQALPKRLGQPYCGSTSGFETSSWFGEASSRCVRRR